MPGSKRERSPGKWTLTVTIGTDYRGKQRRFNKTFHGTAAAAEKALAVFYAECLNGFIQQSSTMTIEQMVTSYINDRPKGSLKQNTIDNYIQCRDVWIAPFIGSLLVRKATPRMLQSWIVDLSQQVSPKTIINTSSLLSAAFDRIIRLGELANNPCKRLVLPKVKKKEAEYMNEKEVRAFLAALEEMPEYEIPFKVLFEIALFCGLRKGELLGLDWRDVDMAKCTVTVRQTRYWDKGQHGMRVDTPKTAKSFRTVSFPPEIKEDIKQLRSWYTEQKKLLGSEWISSPAVFRTPFGAPMNDYSPLKVLHALQERHDLKKVTLHQLRHTNVSIMISMGLDIKTIQARGGYSNASTPLNIYGHIYRNQDSEVACKIYDITTGKEQECDKRATNA